MDLYSEITSAQIYIYVLFELAVGRDSSWSISGTMYISSYRGIRKYTWIYIAKSLQHRYTPKHTHTHTTTQIHTNTHTHTRYNTDTHQHTHTHTLQHRYTPTHTHAHTHTHTHITHTHVQLSITHVCNEHEFFEHTCKHVTVQTPDTASQRHVRVMCVCVWERESERQRTRVRACACVSISIMYAHAQK